jgi:hypothetical protein
METKSKKRMKDKERNKERNGIKKQILFKAPISKTPDQYKHIR